MTFEELEARIKELEEENKKLRGAIKHTSNKRAAVPDYICKKFQRNTNPGRYRRDEALKAIGRDIRKICFPEYSKMQMHHYGDGRRAQKIPYDYAFPVSEMSTEQYARYIEILNELSDVLVKYDAGEIVVKEQNNGNDES